VSRELRRCGGLARGGEPDLLGLLPLVALATVCDVVPLTGLNRALVAQGLRLTARRDIPGLVALADAARMSGPPSVYHLGFVLGPRINAGGRIGRSELGYRLLASVEVAEVEQLAGELERLNAERQAIEQAALVEAGEMVEAGGGRGGVIVVASERWHPGIVGLVAARLVERYRRPAIAIAVGADGTSRGSGRSVPGVDLGAAVRAAADAGIILRGGGHAMAAGLTVGAGGIEALAGFVNDASRELMALIERAGPFGMGHPEPVFAFAAHRVSFAKTVGHGHVRVNLAAEDGSRLDGVAFRAAGTALGDALAAPGRSALHVAGRLKASAWQGRERIELVIEDAARPR
jgi:single-stranded-DNA-specific exonuclease